MKRTRVLPSSKLIEVHARSFGLGSGGRVFDLAIGSSDRLYVTDYHNDSVLVYNLIGTHLGQWGEHHRLKQSAALFDSPSGIFVRKSDVDGSSEAVYSEINKVCTLRSFPPGLCPIILAYFRWDEIYVADTYGHRILVLDTKGRILRSFGSRLVSPWPRSVSVPGSHIVALCKTNQLCVFDSDGTLVKSWHNEVFGFAHDMEMKMAVGSNQSIRCITSIDFTEGVAVFDLEGKCYHSWSRESDTRRLLMDQEGNIYDCEKGCPFTLRQLDCRDGTPILDRAWIVRDVVLGYPTAIATHGNILYLMDKNNAKVICLVPATTN